MNFEVYCDESGLEALTRKDAHRFTAIGGIWMPADYRKVFKGMMQTILEGHGIGSELKWKKVSPASVEAYADVIRYFFDTPQLRFRVILIEADSVDNERYHQKDAELSFYKFYYQLLHHWIFEFNKYDIFLDYKVNRNKGRLNELKRVLCNANIFSEIGQLQALDSAQSYGIQLADILTGLVASKFNGKSSGSAKQQLISVVESYLGSTIQPTQRWEEKFNVFKINLQGGW